KLIWPERSTLPCSSGLSQELSCYGSAAPFYLSLLGSDWLFIALPLGRKLGVRDKVRLNAPPNPVLETFYATHSKKPKEQCDLPTTKVERWFRYRRNQDKPMTWREQTYSAPVLFAPLQRSVYWYYMMELSFALSLTFTMAFDVKRKDFKEQIVHHATTIILISYSYCANYLRIGSLVMLLHVSSTFLLELTKLLHYLNWRRASHLLFLIFSSVFLVTRLIIFPFCLLLYCRVLYTSFYTSMELYQPYFGYYFMNALLMVLQLLHVFWASLIIHMLYRFNNGTVYAWDGLSIAPRQALWLVCTGLKWEVAMARDGGCPLGKEDGDPKVLPLALLANAILLADLIMLLRR
uniref:TLC domain-containing protein n=1 Tax=Chelonoidis abingdonii TaxID=106734 RepID=A0A8C0GU81_CHEAB